MRKFNLPPGVLVRVGSTKITTLATKTGVNPNTLRWHLWKRGISPMRDATRSAGMSTADVARALGIQKSTVYRYIERGWLTARAGYAFSAARVTLDADDVSAFVQRIGGLLPLKPDRLWEDEYIAAREKLHRTYISSAQLASALIIPRQQLTWMQTNKGMPAPSFELGALGKYYCRAALLAWLDTTPNYDRPSSRSFIQGD